jgi:hypothetical protein
MNSTNEYCPINIPGLWHNGDCSLLCRPTKWYDILIFFLGNYLAHVATVVSPPGVSIVTQMFNLMGALLLPFSGIGLGFEAIASLAIRAPTPLTTVARSGALLMIVPTKKARGSVQEPSSQQASVIELAQMEEPTGCTDPERNTKEALPSRPYRPWTAKKIHGNLCLPKGYKFEVVPYYTEFENDEEEVRCKHKDKVKTSKWYDFLFGFSERNRTTNDVACSYNGAKAIVSIVQTMFGIYTLDRTKGNQIERFGYAAFGLTVTPYALMGIVNLLGNLLRPDYPSMYIVGSKSSDDLQQDYECTIATVGRIKGGTLERKPKKDQSMRAHIDLIVILGFVAILAINLSVLGIMTNFTNGQSTVAQRVWTMCWLACGAFYGLTVHFLRESGFDISSSQQKLFSGGKPSRFYGAFAVLVYGVPTIGGFVVVAQMIRQYGVCSKMIDVSV